ncbi:MAG: dihydrolipoamide acetyltransferase family protein [Armatimonadota bacterium]
MAKLLKMPALGQTVEEVRILQWYKNEGDTLVKGERIAEIETDKVNIDWESQDEGIVRRILAPVDSFVKVEAPVLIVGTADEPIDDLISGGSVAEESAATPTPAGEAVSPKETVSTAVPATVKAEGPIFVSPRARRMADELGVAVSDLAGRGTGPGGRIVERDIKTLQAELEAGAAAAMSAAGRGPKSSPLARAVASGAGLDIAALSGSGPGGRITAEDVRGTVAASAPSPSPATVTGGGSRTITLTGLRKRVAENIARSVRNSPHVTLNLQVDMTEAMSLRKQLLPAIEKKTGVRVSPTDIIVKALSVALAEFPNVNAHIDGDNMTLFEDIHIGLAVSLGDEGLIVPVIKNVQSKGLGEIAKDRQDLAARARANKLGGADITGGTFTVSSLGNYGIQGFNPIINPPQVAILGVCAITDTVVAKDGAPAIRPMMGLSLSFDHRAMDGAPAAAFLARLREILETPTLLLV